MKISLNTNLASLSTFRYLDQTTKALGQNYERLSSGLRINSAADDAAGLAIAQREETQARVLQQASRNINDGVSLLSIADSATEQISSMLVRMGELAEQSANGTLTNSQRWGLDQEFQALDAEIRRIADATEFNGIKLLEGERSSDTGEQIDTVVLGAYSVYGVSGNGRYALYKEGSSAFFVYDHETGTSKSVIGGLISISDAQVLDNGDVVYGYAPIPGQVNLNYFDYEQTTTTTLNDSIVSGDLVEIDVSADGSTIVFSSKTIYADGEDIANGSQGSSANSSIYALDVETGIVNVFGQESTDFTDIKISANGRYVTFASSDDYTGENPDGTRDVFVIDFAQEDPVAYQLTNDTSSVASDIAGVSNDGTVIFKSNNDLVGNGNSTQQIFKSTIDGQITQLTNFTGAGNVTRGMTVDASTVYISSTQDLTGENPLGATQIFSIDTGDGTIKQLSNLRASATFSNGSVSADGTRLVFSDNTGTIELISADLSRRNGNIEIETGFGQTDSNIMASIQDVRTTLNGLGGTVISSQSSALLALDRISESIDTLGIIRGELGAGISRLQTAFNVTQGYYTELENAVSAIRDVDVASESAELTRNTIVQQAAASVLTQANQQPSLVLSLLDGV